MPRRTRQQNKTMETLREQLKDEVKTLLRDELTPIVKQELRAKTYGK